MRKYFIYAAAALGLASCANDSYLGGESTGSPSQGTSEITFGSATPNLTRANYVGATAAEKLGGMFVVEGTKGSEQTTTPTTTPVFDNYLVGYTANTAGTTESNTNNWEYVGQEAGITDKLSSTTWSALHTTGSAQSQTIKYWDYSTAQYDFVAWSTGTCEAVADAAASGKVKVTTIDATSKSFTMTAASAADLQQCYYTDVNKVLKADYGKVVTLTFRNMAAKVRVALYETVPGYSVKDVKFYTVDGGVTPTDLGTGTSTTATLFTTGSDKLPQSGAVTVSYPRTGTNNNSADDYNKATVSVTAGTATATTQTFGTLSNYAAAESNEATGNVYLGRTLPTCTYAGASSDNYYTAVIPNTDGKPLTLRVDYTLVSTDGSGETINIHGAKAVVPATYTNWLSNYAYTYVFKISDNSNGWTSTDATNDPAGLFPITFDAVVTSFTDANAEQTTVTTVATPSITTYQQGHTTANNEYSMSQKAGADQTNVKDLYVQVMNTSTATPYTDLSTTGKSLLFSLSDATASEAEVMDALQYRTNALSDASPVGRNGITLTTNANISNTETSIVNGVNDQPITGLTTGQVAKIDIDQLTTGTYAYVYASTVPTSDEKVYAVIATTSYAADKYYEVTKANIDAATVGASGATAAAGYVYFKKNVDANGDFVSYTFIQTKVGDSVEGLYGVVIPSTKASSATVTTGSFYFDVYNKNNGKYAVKVIKVVA